ncbi:Slx4 endonuclease-like protein [Elsinoe fawcettii]|nr:Slx4 endonuclease-like protein [Elsinoe fawcettii]
MAATSEAPIVLSSSSPIRTLATYHRTGYRDGRSGSLDVDLPSPSAFLRQTPGQLSSPAMRPSETMSAHWPQTKDAPVMTNSAGDLEADDTAITGKLSKPSKRLAPSKEQEELDQDVLNLPAQPIGDAEQAVQTKMKAGTKRKRPAKTATDENGAPKPRRRVAKAKGKSEDVDADEGANTAPKRAAARGRKKTTKDTTLPADTDGQEAAEGREVSHHFGANGDNESMVTSKTTSKRGSKGEARAATPPDVLGLDVAPTRRLSWTPIMDQEQPPSNQQDHESSEDAFMDPKEALDMLNKFGYQGEEEATVAKPKKTTTTATRKKKVAGAEVAPKRKRVVEKDKVVAPKKPKEPKKPKAPKKPRAPKVVRPKTITDYAISAYRKEPEREEKAMSEFFQPTSTQIVRLENDPSSILEPEHMLKAAKKMTTTVQFQFPEPEKAVAKMRDQDFLFGTSSQLEKDDSPRTHKMMQQAIKASEEQLYASQALSSDVETSPTTSRLKVVSAPHGTSLSVGPGESNLWSAAARDKNARTFMSTPRPSRRLITNEEFAEVTSHDRDGDMSLDANHYVGSAADTTPGVAAVLEPALPEMVQAEPDEVNIDNQSQHDSGFVDISEAEKSHPEHSKAPKQQNAAAILNPEPHANDEFVLISSSPAIEIARPALQNLDVNTSIVRVVPTEGLKLTSTAVMASPRRTSTGVFSQPMQEVVLSTKRGRGKPRKDSTSINAAEGEVMPQKRPRGRPRKDSSPGDAFEDIDEVLKRPRGRPRKDSSPARQLNQATASAKSSPPRRAASPKPTPRRNTIKTTVTTPKLQRRSTAIPAPSSRDWHDIDEISDSEASAPSLSPPRRSASSPPTSPRKLDLAPDPASKVASQAGPSLAISTAISTSLTEEDIQALKAQQQATLFKTISRVVKGAPRTTDPAHPSWHEKMLMYDPIVLEDLTAWLVGQGVKPDGTVVPVPAPRDPSVVIEDNAAGAEDNVEQTEKSKKSKSKGKAKAKVAEEKQKKKDELQPWMVQKWCESNSICCLWKEGLRGGVRQRY